MAARTAAQKHRRRLQHERADLESTLKSLQGQLVSLVDEGREVAESDFSEEGGDPDGGVVERDRVRARIADTEEHLRQVEQGRGRHRGGDLRHLPRLRLPGPRGAPRRPALDDAVRPVQGRRPQQLRGAAHSSGLPWGLADRNFTERGFSANPGNRDPGCAAAPPPSRRSLPFWQCARCTSTSAGTAGSGIDGPRQPAPAECVHRTDRHRTATGALPVPAQGARLPAPPAPRSFRHSDVSRPGGRRDRPVPWPDGPAHQDRLPTEP